MNSGAPAYPTSGIRCVTLVKNPVILAQKVVPGHLLHKFWNTGSTERERYTRYSYAARMLPHINGKFTIGKLKSSVVVSLRSYRLPLSFLCLGKAMNPI